MLICTDNIWVGCSWDKVPRVYFPLWGEHRPAAVNGFLALQPPYIVRYTLPQCHACHWALWGLDSIWHPSTHVVLLHRTPTFPLSLFQQPLTREVASVSPVGMVSLPSPSQATLAGPHTLLGVWAVCVGEQALLAWLQSSWHRATTSPPCLIYP